MDVTRLEQRPYVQRTGDALGSYFEALWTTAQKSGGLSIVPLSSNLCIATTAATTAIATPTSSNIEHNSPLKGLGRPLIRVSLSFTLVATVISH